MPELELFQAALGLTPPWRVVGSDFDAAAGKLTIAIDYPQGSRFSCPTCGRAACPVYDVEPKRWRHLNFWQYENRAHRALAQDHLRNLRGAAGRGVLGQSGQRLHRVVRGPRPHPSQGDAGPCPGAALQGTRPPDLAHHPFPRRPGAGHGGLQRRPSSRGG